VVSERSIIDYRRALNRHGLCILIGGSIAAFFQGLLPGPWNSMRSSKEVTLLTSWNPNSKQDVQDLIRLVETQAIRPIIDRTYPLEEIPEAIRYLEGGQARGKVVITVGGDGAAS